jgi:hypothetical protein
MRFLEAIRLPPSAWRSASSAENVLQTSGDSLTSSGNLRREITYGRDPERVRIFVSSQMDGTLDAERRAAAETINATAFLEAWWWEGSTTSGPYWAEEECLNYAATSDGLLLLLGTKLTRVTRGEYESAQRSGAACFIFIREFDHMTQRAHAFVRREQKKDDVTRKFQNESELRSEITKALLNAAVRFWRLNVADRSASFGTAIPRAAKPPHAGRRPKATP